MNRPISDPLTGPTVEKEIGGTHFIVTAHYADNGETAVEIMRRIILRESAQSPPKHE